MRSNWLGLVPISQYHGNADMPKSVQIVEPPLSLEEIGRRLHISRARRKTLGAILNKAKAAFARELSEPVESVGPEKRRKRASAA